MHKIISLNSLVLKTQDIHDNDTIGIYFIYKIKNCIIHYQDTVDWNLPVLNSFVSILENTVYSQFWLVFYKASSLPEDNVFYPSNFVWVT